MRKSQLTAPNDIVKLSPMGIAIDRPINGTTPTSLDLAVADSESNFGQGSYAPVQLKAGAHLSIDYNKQARSLTLNAKLNDTYAPVVVDGPTSFEAVELKNILAINTVNAPDVALTVKLGMVADVTELYGETYHIAFSGKAGPGNLPIQLSYVLTNDPTTDIFLNFYAGGIEGSMLKQDKGTDIGLVIMPDPNGGIGSASALLLMSGQPVIVTVA